MKSFAFSSLLPIALLAISASASPEGALKDMAGSSNAAGANATAKYGPCRDKYRGNMIINLGGTDVSKYKQLGVSGLGQNKTLQTADAKETQVVKFIFQECQIDGWNAGQEEFGHLIIAGQGNATSLAAETKALPDGSFPLSMQPTIANATEDLARQWFYANYFAGSDGNPSIQLQLFGNPLEDGKSFRAPHALVQTDDTVSVDNNTTTPYFSKLRIVDPEIMHMQPMVANKPTTNEQKITAAYGNGQSFKLADVAKSFLLSTTNKKN